MSISLKKARDFVFRNGSRWEVALFEHLFLGGDVARVHQALLCYKNPDGGWAYGLEQDISTPDSNPLGLEFLLSVIRDTGIDHGTLFAGSAAWLEANRNEDGSLKNPASVLEYPHAEWWAGGGQNVPASITGNLIKLGLCTDSILESTQRWMQENYTLAKIAENEWLFMCYRPFDYFMNVTDYPDLDKHKAATLDNLIVLAESAPEKQYATLLSFAPTPEAMSKYGIPERLFTRTLDYLMENQREDGRWDDEHGLEGWHPYITTTVLLALKRYEREIGP